MPDEKEIVDNGTVDSTQPKDKPADNTVSDNNSGNPTDTPEDKPKDEPTKEPEINEPEKQDKPEDKPVEPDTTDNVKIAGLEAEVQRLTDELAKLQGSDVSKVALEQANALLSVQKGLVSEYEGIINGIIETKLSNIPENLKALVPENLNTQQKLDWINKAEQTGIFKAKNTDVEIGKPMNPNKGLQNMDNANLSPSARMALAYANTQKGIGKK